MLMLTLICVLAGAVLGQRFKVLVLLPAVTLAMIVSVAIGIARADAVWPIVLMAAAASVGLQIGYFAGSGLREFLVFTRASRLQARSLPSPASARRSAH